jgi:hypothetical protein
MKKKGLLTKILAAAGTMLVWVPILIPLLMTGTVLLQSGRLRLDYLMPAELALLALAGGGLLVWAALRARTRLAWVGWGLGGAFGCLALGLLVATLTGLASGAIEPDGWQSAVVTLLVNAYTVGLAAAGTGGVFLLRDLFRPHPFPAG